ncbi:reverse transcriptase domain-containing protein, partial [Bosea sp. (in: a-proteobacteria)]|uniref:reverse transcriptase domain-containing protein n=1 Tax=Bosea sp. (in: a-proteobacteria) TaxID=1871050 RepID=UPI00403457B1
MLSYGTWELVELPEGCRPLANRWVWSVKRDGRGSIVRFKARLVVKGFLQREGIDFHELHAPVSKHATVRALLAVAAAEDMELEHLDVKTAFLNGRLEEVIYMHQPAGYEDGSGRVCRLHRALYGLRQAPRAWHARLKEELEQLGFTASAADSCLFTMMRGSSKVLLAVYVDDCLLAVSKGDMGTLEWVKQQLAAVFDIHQLGPVEQFLGMRISRDRAARQLVLSQEQYALSVVDRYGLADSRPRAVPLSTAEQLQREGVQQQSEGGHSFAEVIGSLQHLAVVSRPDIAHAVGVLAKFMSAPTKEHWRVLRGVLRYVADTAAMGLMYGASAGLVGFCDADFAGDTDTRRSTTGHVFMLHGGAVSWSSRRQPTVAASTTESEYMACSAAGKEGLWLRGVLADLSLGSAVVQPVTIMCDNEAALTLVKHPIASARSKHIDVLHHFVRERVARGELVFKFCGSAANVADVFTKALPSVKF